MEPKSLKEKWLESETHRFIAEKMLILENGFEINNIEVIMFNKSTFGAHIEFNLNGELCFITILTDYLISESDCNIYEGSIYNLLVVKHNDYLEISFSSLLSEIVYRLKCQELTMGPVFGKRINI